MLRFLGKGCKKRDVTFLQLLISVINFADLFPIKDQTFQTIPICNYSVFCNNRIVFHAILIEEDANVQTIADHRSYWAKRYALFNEQSRTPQ